MPQRPVSPEPGRDGDPGRAEEDWLAWCDAVADSSRVRIGGGAGGRRAVGCDMDALIAECREITAEQAAGRAGVRGGASPPGSRSPEVGGARASPGRRAAAG